MKTLGKWERVRPGWYRAQNFDGGLWIHVVQRQVRNWWDICATTDKFSCSSMNAVKCGFPLKRDAQHDAVQMYGEETR